VVRAYHVIDGGDDDDGNNKDGEQRFVIFILSGTVLLAIAFTLFGLFHKVEALKFKPHSAGAVFLFNARPAYMTMFDGVQMGTTEV
jgi:hypothetical protein